ncbi:hypothetical protein QE454_001646 [Microbacterium sp. SORGH_AS454]|nr:hypothetical protein [Microbacterium sp. SORGH_AS_0454]
MSTAAASSRRSSATRRAQQREGQGYAIGGLGVVEHIREGVDRARGADGGEHLGALDAFGEIALARDGGRSGETRRRQRHVVVLLCERARALQPARVRVGAVAAIERRRDLIGARPAQRGELGCRQHLAAPTEQRRELRGIRASYGGAAVAGAGHGVQSQRESGQGLLMGLGVQAIVSQPPQVLLDEGQGARLVAGQGAEHDVVGDDREVVGVLPRQTVAAQMERAGLIEATRPQQREKGQSESALGLLSAGEAALDHLLDQADGLVLSTCLGEEPGELAADAGVAVAVVVTRCRLEAFAQRGGLVDAPGRPRVLESRHHRTAHAHTGAVVVLFHVIEDGVDLLARELRRAAQGAGHPLVLPEQVAGRLQLGGEALGIRVVLREAPRERREHEIGVADHVGARGLTQARFVLEARVTAVLRAGHRLGDEGSLPGAPRRPVDLVEQGTDALGGGGHAGPFVVGSEEEAASSTRSARADDISARSPPPRGWWPASSAWT